MVELQLSGEVEDTEKKKQLNFYFIYHKSHVKSFGSKSEALRQESSVETSELWNDLIILKSS
jgi:hypothetical protein